MVNATGNLGDLIHRLYTTPQYIQVSRKEFNIVEIDIRDDTGRPVPFEFGKVVVTLHLNVLLIIMRKQFCCDASRALYEDYYKRQMGGEVTVVYGARTQRGYGLGSILGSILGRLLEESCNSYRAGQTF